MRIAAGIEYRGTRYHGWQTQRGVSTVQERVETGLARVADRPVSVVPAGRTDKGVHALGQVVHFDTTANRNEKSWLFGTNSNLPPDICLNWVRNVDSTFHARYSAYARRYRYLIHNARSRSALLDKAAAWVREPLNASSMDRAGQNLIGEHDFSAFRAAGCQSRTPWRELRALRVTRKRNLVILDVEANAFLHHMVRNIAGVLIRIGAGEAQENWAAAVLESRDRRTGGVNASPHGLYFIEALYPGHFGLQDLNPPHPVLGL